MKSDLTVIFIVTSCLVCTARSQVQPQSDNVKPAQGTPRFTDLDWNLSKEMGIQNREEENVVVSAMSLRVILATLMDGSLGNTSAELAKILQEQPLPKSALRERYSNILKSLRTSVPPTLISDVETRLYAHKTATIDPNFQRVLWSSYKTTVDVVDFARVPEVVQKVNSWAAEVTQGNIQNLISEDDTNSDAVMLLLNIIFFKGTWEYPFPENQTTDDIFHLDNRKYIRTKMMKDRQTLLYASSHNEDIQIVRLPYQNGTFAMYIVLPRGQSRIHKLIDGVNPTRIHNLMETMENTTLNLSIPRFEFSYSVGLKDILRKNKVETMFTPQADFSPIEGHKSQLLVSNIIQKAGIKVNEKGSIASAATTVDFVNKVGDETPVDFNVNRPFLFFIEEDKSRNVVFVGKVTNPNPNSEVLSWSHSAPAPEGSWQPNIPTRPQPLRPHSNIPTTTPSSLRTIPEDDIERQTFFDKSLLQEVGKRETENFAVSPASIKSVLGLLYLGAENKTASELAQSLRLSDDVNVASQQLYKLLQSIKSEDKSQVKLKCANTVFISNKITPKPEFKADLKRNMLTPLKEIDFTQPGQAEERINNWVRGITEDHIQNLFKKGTLKPDTSLALVNAIYFNGQWLESFPHSETQPKDFHVSPSEKIQVDMMHLNKSMIMSYSRDLKSYVLQIPYKDEKHYFVVILPQKRFGIDQLLKDISQVEIGKILKNNETVEVRLALPKFEIDFDSELTDALKSMSIHNVFSETSAQLGKIADGRRLRVSIIQHKVIVKVTEDGTIAAAATGSAVVPLIAMKEVEFIVDHPFFFFIYNKDTGVILFEGRVNKPQRSTRKLPGDIQSSRPSDMPYLPLNNKPVSYPEVHQRFQPESNPNIVYPTQNFAAPSPTSYQKTQNPVFQHVIAGPENSQAYSSSYVSTVASSSYSTQRRGGLGK